MAGITNGAELVKLLRESGTPPECLLPARWILAKVHEESGKVATAHEIGKALEDALGTEHGTVQKAIRLIETGKLPEPRSANVVQIEDKLLSGERPDKADKPPDPKPVVVRAPEPAEPKAPDRPVEMVREKTVGPKK